MPKAQYQQYQIRHCCEQRSHFFESDSGYWLREGDYFVNFKTLLNDDEYLDVNVFELNQNYRLLRHIKAKRAVASIDERILILQDAELFLFGKENRIQKRIAERLQIPFMISELTHTMPKSLRQEHMNLRQLYAYIQFLKRSELNTDVHELALWSRLSTMLSILVVILLAIPWIFGSVQSAVMGKRFFTAVLLGLAYIIASQIFGNLSISYHFPAWLGAFLPVILFSLLGFLSVEGDTLTNWVFDRMSCQARFCLSKSTWINPRPNTAEDKTAQTIRDNAFPHPIGCPSKSTTRIFHVFIPSV